MVGVYHNRSDGAPQVGGTAERDVEQGAPGVDAEGVLDEGADVPGAEPCADLQDDRSAAVADDEFGVRGPVADTDGADRVAGLGEHTPPGGGWQDGGQAVAEHYAVRAAGG